MNSIPKKQNEPCKLDLLLVQRALYSKAKTVFTWRIAIALAIAVLGPIVTSLKHDWEAYVGIIAIIYLLGSVFFIERWELEAKNSATKIQEMFDIYLFELPWNEYVIGKKPDTEIIAGVLSSISEKDFSNLKDWYARDVGKVDLDFARFLCQRSNAWWDATLRSTYILFLLALLLAVIAVAVIFSVITNLTVAKLVMGVIVPILPFIEVVVTQIKNNREAANVIRELKVNIDTEIEKRINGEPPKNAESIARIFQDQIWHHRSKCPMIFDWVHNIKREKLEKQMRFSVTAKVEEFLTKNPQR